MTEKKNSKFQDSEDDIILDRSESFIAIDSVEETVDNDESSFVVSEKPDEYIENLMDVELAQAEAEAEAELKKEAKRKKDKAKAHEKDKKAQEEAHKKHEQDLAREKERLVDQEQARADGKNNLLVDDKSYSITDSQIDFKSSEDIQFDNTFKERPVFVSNPDVNDSKEIKEFSEQVDYDLPQSSPRDEQSSYFYSSATLTNDIAPSVDVQDNKLNDFQDSYNIEPVQKSSTSEFPDNYSERKYKEQRDALYDEQIERQQFDKEQNEAFFERIHQNAYEKQRASEQYQSFGNEGIDYSGNNQHSAYIYNENVVANENIITESAYQAIREDYEKSKAEVRAYKNTAPAEVLEQYRHSSELYFATERRIHEGSLQVKPETEFPLRAKKTEHFEYATGYNYDRDDYKFTQPEPGVFHTTDELRPNNTTSPSVTPDSQDSQAYHYKVNNDNTATDGFVFSSSRQDMARRAQDVLVQIQNDETFEQPKSSSPHISESERGTGIADTRDSTFNSHRLPNNFVGGSGGEDGSGGSGIYNISQERYESLKTKYLNSVKEVASYEGKEIPPSVIKRNEQINKVYSAIKEKVDSGKVNVVSEDNVSPSLHSGRHINNGNNIKNPSNGNSNAILGSQVISELNKHNYSPKSERTGDGHRKPPKTPVQASPLSKYDKLKIYHSRNYLAPVEQGARRTVGALKDALVYGTF